MTNYTTETYQTRRYILNFSKKISEGTYKATEKINPRYNFIKICSKYLY